MKRIIKLHKFFCRESKTFVSPKEYRKGFLRAYVRFMWFSLQAA